MPVFDLFSKRQKRLRGEVPDVYQYEELNQNLRTQIVHIWNDSLGGPEDYDVGRVSEIYKFIVNTLCREYGVFSLLKQNYHIEKFYFEFVEFFIETKNLEHAIDCVELAAKCIDLLTREYSYMYRRNFDEIADQAIKEINERFDEHGFGFEYVSQEIIRRDSEFLHAEVVLPALRLLNSKGFKGAQEEFLLAHAHYRKGEAKSAMTECLKAFESTMKSICGKRGWDCGKNATAKNLIKICFDNGIVPAFWESHYSSLRSMLESGVPTGRNKLSGHGQGEKPVEVPRHLVGYMLHMTAAAIVFLVEAEEESP